MARRGKTLAQISNQEDRIQMALHNVSGAAAASRARRAFRAERIYSNNISKKLLGKSYFDANGYALAGIKNKKVSRSTYMGLSNG